MIKACTTLFLLLATLEAIWGEEEGPDWITAALSYNKMDTYPLPSQ